MTTPYLAWQHPKTRRWFPIGRLVRKQSGAGGFEFAYVGGAREAEKNASFKPIPEFPDFDRTYRAPDLFPTFRNRAMNTSRADRPGYLRQLGLDETDCDALSELSASGGRSHVDNFEIFPEIEPDPKGRFHTELSLHGLRHMNPHAIEAVQELREGDELGVGLELTNPVTTHSLLVHSRGYCTLGWLPRYFVEAIHECCDWTTLDPKLTVARVNPRAPLSHRLRVHVSGRLRPGVNPMRDLERYRPVGAMNGGAASPESMQG